MGFSAGGLTNTGTSTDTPKSLGGGLVNLANSGGARLNQREYDLANPNTRNDLDYVGIGGLGTQPKSLPMPNPYDLNATNPVNQSSVGYGNFPLNPNTGGVQKSYANAFDIQAGDTDYTKAAKVQAQGNLAAAQQAATANRVNQINPYGSIRYYQSGVDAQGNPTYSAAASLSPEQQQLLNAQNYQSLGLAQTANQALENVYNTYGQQFNVQPFAQMGLNPSTSMQGWDRASNLMMQRLQPQIDRQEQRLEQQLANQGIPRGSEAYTRAKQDFAMQQNDLLNQAQLQAQAVQQNLFNQEVAGQQFNNAARLNNFQLASYLRGLPMQELNALRQGSQVTNPSFIGVPQQGTVGGPDTLAAYQAQQNANIAAANRDAASRSNLTSGLFDLGGSVLGNLGGIGSTIGNVVGGATKAVSSIGNAVGKLFSDPRLKENIKAVGVMDNGLTLYSFEYKDEVKSHPMGGEGVHIGVMADEVEQVFPYAVSTLDDGYKVVNYSLLP
jgi:hypothetical protein